MLRTIKEATDLIQKKSDSALIDYNREWSRKYPNKERLASLKGQAAAYEDCITLIRSSHLLDEDGRIAEARQLVLDLRAQGKSVSDIIKLLGI